MTDAEASNLYEDNIKQKSLERAIQRKRDLAQRRPMSNEKAFLKEVEEVFGKTALAVLATAWTLGACGAIVLLLAGAPL